MYWVYIMASHTRVLYTGVTKDLLVRVWQHREGKAGSFTARYQVNRLVYYDYTPDVMAAIAREKQIKGWGRRRRVRLIEKMNPEWRDFAEEWPWPGRGQG